jgi:CubicO group peptidase (beta-lactamase class C family)
LRCARSRDGLISSLDEKVCETILEWKDDPRKSQITVRHLLTLSSGLVANDESLGRQGAGIQGLFEGSDATPDGSAKEKRDGPIARRIRERRQSETTPDRFAAAVQLPTEAAPGTKFHYGPSHFYAFGEFLDRKLKASNRAERTYFDYLRNRVLVPCGIDVGIDRFAPDSANRPALPSGGHLSAHEWVRFGDMVRRGGLVGTGTETPASRVLSAASLAQCFTPSATNPAYGLTWWIVTGQAGDVARVADRGGFEGEVRRKEAAPNEGTPAKEVARPTQPPAAAKLEPVCDATGKPIAIVMAAGAGGQRLYVIPQADLVVVRFAALGKAGQAYDDATFLRTLLGVAKPADAKDEERGSRLRPAGGTRGR